MYDNSKKVNIVMYKLEFVLNIDLDYTYITLKPLS